MTDYKTISWVSYPGSGRNRVFFVTYDGRVLGDSRGYSTVEQVQEVCFAESDASVKDGLRHLVYRPGYHKGN